VKFETPQGNGEVKEVTSITGEASANNRKGKLIFFYEWDIKLKWKAIQSEEEYDVDGQIEIPNLSEENDMDDVDVTVTAEPSIGSYDMKRLWIDVGVPIVKEKLSDYVKGLKQEFSQGMILPTATSTDKPPQEDKQISIESNSIVKPSTNSSSPSTGLRIHTKKITMTEEFKCTAEELFLTLTEERRVNAFTRCDSQVDPVGGGQFTLFGGNITGKFIEIETDKKIVQKWRFKDWPSEHYSTVTIELVQEVDCTRLNLTQLGVPDSDYDRTNEGWHRYYWDSIKSTFGFGVKLF
jgi:activator of HSP90 ATPase